jgi:hypothetical protein
MKSDRKIKTEQVTERGNALGGENLARIAGGDG